jgi:magnesium transporter
MMTQYAIEHGRIIESDSKSPSGQILVVVAPNSDERRAIQDQLHLDDYDLSSTLDPDEVPRLELAQGRSLLIWKVPESARVSEAIELAVRAVGLVLTPDRLVFLMANGQLSFVDREYRNVDNVNDVLLGFLVQTIRHFVGHLRVIKQLSSELEKKITVSMENKSLIQMFALSESLVYYVDAIEGNGAVLTKLVGIGNQIGLDARQLQVLNDIALENGQAARQAHIFSSVLSGLMDARGTIVNNNMNVLLKNLTLINIVFLPLNLIASILGMSEWTMMTQGMDWRLSYSLLSLGMVAFGWATWVFVRRVIDRNGGRRAAD